MQAEIVRADKSQRTKVVLTLVLFSIATMACYYYFFAGLQDFIASGGEAEILDRLRRVRWLTLGMVVVAVGAAVHFLYIGERVLKSDRFPPPGMRVVRDTPVRTGTRARVIGWLIICASLGLVIASAWVHFLMLQVLASLSS